MQRMISRSTRAGTLGLALVLATLGAFSLRDAPSVSAWAPLQIVEPVGTFPETCGEFPTYDGAVTTFVTADKTYTPAVRLGGVLPIVSLRQLDRDIEGRFEKIIRSDTHSIQLDPFAFSEGMWPGVQEGCQASAFGFVFDLSAGGQIIELYDLMEGATAPVQFRMIETVHIKGAASETYSSNKFWVIPQGTEGRMIRESARIEDPFYEGANG